ncbi:MAG: hypothetical protein Ct9H300mP32_6940 [Verrucomicrobiota bacterium]|nr:MAG: hypothetical protein Ct9H300mP32_6940 [Verrucomicrobiota bacterium]
MLALNAPASPARERQELKKAYHAPFLSDDLLKDAWKKRGQIHRVLAGQLIHFVAASQRGTCSHTGR